MHKVGLIYGDVYVCHCLCTHLSWKPHGQTSHTFSSERELTNCCRPSACLSVCLSVCRQSSITRVHPTQTVVNFGNFTTAFGTFGHPLTCTENLMQIVPGNPLRRGLNPRGVENIAILDPSKAISWKRCQIGGKLVLIINKKSHMGFRLVPKSVTLNDLERRSGCYFRYFSEIVSIRDALRKSGWSYSQTFCDRNIVQSF